VRLDGAVITVRQRVSSVLEDEALVVERIETQFHHLNGVEDVVGGLKRVKFCHGVNFLALQYCQKVFVVDVLFYNVFLYALDLSLRLLSTVQQVHFRPQPTNSRGAREPVSDLNLPSTR